MRVVLYDDETLEALTVITVPGWIVKTFRPHQPIRFAIEQELSFLDATKQQNEKIQTSTFWLERWCRGDKETVVAFTKESENSLKLRSVFLPGQQKEVNRVAEEAYFKALDKIFTQMRR